MPLGGSGAKQKGRVTMFEGLYTAIVTPFDRNGEVDYGRYKELIERQIEGGADGIVPVGTTGESPTLDSKEHIRVIEATVEACDGRVKVIAGTGANSTSEAVDLTLRARDAGVDATLQVTPYYNKPSQEGLYRHFTTIADLGLPVVLYNVPGRSGLEIGIDTVERLTKNTAVVAIKEAGGSVDRVSQILNVCEIIVLCGDDSLTLPMMSVGAVGVISVAGNVVPQPVSEMVHSILEGQMAEAVALHRKYYPLFCDLFVETNPVPVKAALAMMGLIEEEYRLPLCSMDKAKKEKLAFTLRALNLLPEK